jgi:hypothetical protein
MAESTLPRYLIDMVHHPQNQSPELAVSTPDDSRPIVLLFADKDPMNAIKLKQFLTKIIEPFVLHYVRTGVDVLEFLMKKEPYEHVPTPDLLVLTPDLPRVDMYQLNKALKKTRRKGGYLEGMDVLVFEPDISLKRARLALSNGPSPVHPFTYLIASYLDNHRDQYLTLK